MKKFFFARGIAYYEIKVSNFYLALLIHREMMLFFAPDTVYRVRRFDCSRVRPFPISANAPSQVIRVICVA